MINYSEWWGVCICRTRWWDLGRYSSKFIWRGRERRAAIITEGKSKTLQIDKNEKKRKRWFKNVFSFKQEESIKILKFNRYGDLWELLTRWITGILQWNHYFFKQISSAVKINFPNCNFWFLNWFFFLFFSTRINVRRYEIFPHCWYNIFILTIMNPHLLVPTPSFQFLPINLNFFFPFFKYFFHFSFFDSPLLFPAHPPLVPVQ